MTTWVLFFMIIGKFPTTSVNVEFTSPEKCESARQQLSKIIPSQRLGYFQFSTCLEKQA